MLAMFLSSDMLEKIKGIIKNSILENKEGEEIDNDNKSES